MASILLNGEDREIRDGISLAQLIESLDLPDKRIAVEVNSDVIRKKDWSGFVLGHEDRLEIVHFVGGG